MNTNAFLRLVRHVQRDMVDSYSLNAMHLPNAPRMVLASGLTMSVQASMYHYCEPRESNASEYSAVEVGFPSQEVPELMPYADDAEQPTGTVYGYVPTSILDAVIQQHGGIVGIQSL